MSSLCKSFVILAHYTSCDLRHAWASGLLFGEETITERNLLELKRRHPKSVVLQSFTKSQEAANGADWEWWFVDRPSLTGFPIRVQAKRLSKRSTTFGRLLTYRAPKAPKPQIDMLIDQANSAGMVPIHCFYINERVSKKLGDEFRSRFPYLDPRFEFGCWVGLSTKIRSAQKKRLKDLHGLIFPWHFLVCAAASDSPINSSLPMQVRNTLERPPNVSEQEQAVNLELPEVSRLPDYVLELLDRGRIARPQLLERNIRGIALFMERREGIS